MEAISPLGQVFHLLFRQPSHPGLYAQRVFRFHDYGRHGGCGYDGVFLLDGSEVAICGDEILQRLALDSANHLAEVPSVPVVRGILGNPSSLDGIGQRGLPATLF